MRHNNSNQQVVILYTTLPRRPPTPQTFLLTHLIECLGFNEQSRHLSTVYATSSAGPYRTSAEESLLLASTLSQRSASFASQVGVFQ